MRLYQANGYLDMASIRRAGYPFTIVINGRGTGKTFNGLYDLLSSGTKFIYLRRTQTQIDQIRIPGLDPFSDINRKMGTSYIQAPLSKKTTAIYKGQIVDGELKPAGEPLGYLAALSTFATMRGIADTTIEVMFFDEFIPEWNERPIKEEYQTLKQALETIGRNRELEGKPPLQLIAVANSNTIANPILVGMGIVEKVIKMVKNKSQILTIPERGIMVVCPTESPISEAKKNTVLYKLNSDEFSYMALGNIFPEFSNSKIKSMPLREYKPVCRVGEITIYQHKSLGEIYVSTHAQPCPYNYGVSDVELERFNNDFRALARLYLSNDIIFQTQTAELLFRTYTQK